VGALYLVLVMVVGAFFFLKASLVAPFLKANRRLSFRRYSLEASTSALSRKKHGREVFQDPLYVYCLMKKRVSTVFLCFFFFNPVLELGMAIQ